MNIPTHLFALLLTLVTVTVSAKSQPNIIFMLTDDLGWTDLGCFGSAYYETPNLDKLASQGMRFSAAYSSCTVCSPSRASVMTGQYPARLHITDWISGHERPYAKLKIPDWTQYLSTNICNMASVLKSAGYATACIGKWHLGGAAYWPENQGFDFNAGGCNMGQPPNYFSPYKIPTLKDGPAGEFLSDRLTSEAIGFMEKNKDKPFFIYFPHYAVHTPLMAKKEVIEKYKGKTDPKGLHKNPTYAGLIESVDDSMGRLLKTLEDLKLSDNTIIFFTSDNGGLKSATNNDPLRAGKGSAYEGGVRVPLIVKWPGVTQAGSTSTIPVIGADYFPTLLEIAGVATPARHVVDGESIVPLLKQNGTLKRDAIYWHYPHYHPGGATPYGAIREGDFRLVEFYEDAHVELYNVNEDVSESNNLALTNPDKATALRTKLSTWRQHVGAQMPSPNPNFDTEKERVKPQRKNKPKEE
jgi:arylsulfatase A-like enzyme